MSMDAEVSFKGMDRLDAEIQKRRNEIDKLERDLEATLQRYAEAMEKVDGKESRSQQRVDAGIIPQDVHDINAGKWEAERARALQAAEAKSAALEAQLTQVQAAVAAKQRQLAHERDVARALHAQLQAVGHDAHTSSLMISRMTPQDNFVRTVMQANMNSSQHVTENLSEIWENLPQDIQHKASSMPAQIDRALSPITRNGVNSAYGNITGTAANWQNRSAKSPMDTSWKVLSEHAQEQLARVEAARRMAMGGLPESAKANEGIASYENMVRGTLEGREGFTPGKIKAKSYSVGQNILGAASRAENVFGKDAAGVIRDSLDERFSEVKGGAAPGAIAAYNARAAVDKAESLGGSLGRSIGISDRMEERGNGSSAKDFRSQAVTRLKALNDALAVAEQALDALPEGAVFDQLRGDLGKRVEGLRTLQSDATDWRESQVRNDERRREQQAAERAAGRAGDRSDRVRSSLDARLEDLASHRTEVGTGERTPGSWVSAARSAERYFRKQKGHLTGEERDAYAEKFGDFRNQARDTQARAQAEKAAGKAANAEEKEKTRLFGSVDKAEATWEQRFRGMDDLLKQAADLRASGKEKAADSIEKTVYRKSLGAVENVQQLEDLIDALHENGEVLRAATLREKMDDWKFRAGGMADRYAPKDSQGSIGSWAARGLKDIPVIGKPMYHLGGKAIAQKIDDSVIGQAATGVAQALAGKVLHNPTAAQAWGANAVTKIKPLALNPVTIAAALAGGFFMGMSGKARKDFGRGEEARNEEIRFGNLGNRLGTSDRILDDIRNPTTKHLDDRLLRMRFGSGDYAGMVESMGLAGLKGENRRETAMRALQFSRASGLGIEATGALANQLGRGSVERGLNVQGDLVRFAQAVKEGVKEGVAGEEMSRAFSGALERQRTASGGVLGQGQRDDLMEQLIAATQTGVGYMRGQTGADKMAALDDAVGGFKGKDTAFMYSALRGKSAGELGYTGADAKMLDGLLKSDPYNAVQFIQRNQTNETRGLFKDRFLSAYGQSTSTLTQGLTGLGIDGTTAIREASSIREQMKAGKPVKSALLDSWSGRYDASKLGTGDQAMKEEQGGNQGFQVAGRQEMRANEVKLLASKVVFDSTFNRNNIDFMQDAGTKKEEARNWIVSNTGNRVANDSTLANPDRNPYGKNSAGDVRTLGREEVAEGLSNPARLGRTLPGHAHGGMEAGSRNEVAGVFHGGEFVMRAEAVDRLGSGNLAKLNAGGNPFAAKGDESAGLLAAILLELRRRNQEEIASKNSAGTLAAEMGPGGRGGLMGFIKGLPGALRGLLGGGEGGGGGAAPDISGAPAFQGGGSGTLAAVAQAGITDAAFESVAGWCSRFVRQATEKALGRSDGALSGVLFGASAIESGNLWKKRNMTLTPEQVAKSGGYQAGDVLFTMSGSGGYGHTGIVSADGKYVIENSTRGKGGKMMTPINQFGRVDLVGRLGLDKDGDLRGDGGYGVNPAGAPQSFPGGVPAGSAGAFIRAIGEQESGNDYGAVNKRTGALGKYQIMWQNLNGWGKNAGKKNFGWDYDALGRDVTREEFLRSPELQEKIAQHQLKKAHAKYGTAGAARWWYSNSAASSNVRPAAGEPTPNEYAAQVAARMAKFGSSPAAGGAKVTGTVQHVVSGNVTINGSADARASAAARDAVINRLRSGGNQVAPAANARPRS